jgi:hypothetical protein
MMRSISLFIPAPITIGGLYVLNVISPLQTLQHLHVCPQDVILRPLQIQIIMVYQVMYMLPVHVIIVIQEETVVEKQFFTN